MAERTVPTNHYMKRLGEKLRDQSGEAIETGSVVGFQFGSTGGRYAVELKGQVCQSATTFTGYAPEAGASVMTSRHGPKGKNLWGILGRTHPNRRATQAAESFQRDITNEVMY